MARIAGLGVYSDDPCYDPNHPFWYGDYAGGFHDAYECACLDRDPNRKDERCVFAMPGGTPTNWVKAADVPDVGQVVAQTPGAVIGYGANVAGQAIGQAGKGIGDTLDLSGLLTMAAVAGVAFFVISKR